MQRLASREPDVNSSPEFDALNRHAGCECGSQLHVVPGSRFRPPGEGSTPFFYGKRSTCRHAAIGMFADLAHPTTQRKVRIRQIRAQLRRSPPTSFAFPSAHIAPMAAAWVSTGRSRNVNGWNGFAGLRMHGLRSTSAYDRDGAHPNTPRCDFRPASPPARSCLRSRPASPNQWPAASRQAALSVSPGSRRPCRRDENRRSNPWRDRDAAKPEGRRRSDRRS